MDDTPRRPSPDLPALLAAIKRRNKDAMARDAAPKAANRRALARVLGQMLAQGQDDEDIRPRPGFPPAP